MLTPLSFPLSRASLHPFLSISQTWRDPPQYCPSSSKHLSSSLLFSSLSVSWWFCHFFSISGPDRQLSLLLLFSWSSSAMLSLSLSFYFSTSEIAAISPETIYNSAIMLFSRLAKAKKPLSVIVWACVFSSGIRGLYRSGERMVMKHSVIFLWRSIYASVFNLCRGYAIAWRALSQKWNTCTLCGKGDWNNCYWSSWWHRNFFLRISYIPSPPKSSLFSALQWFQ